MHTGQRAGHTGQLAGQASLHQLLSLEVGLTQGTCKVVMFATRNVALGLEA